MIHKPPFPSQRRGWNLGCIERTRSSLRAAALWPVSRKYPLQMPTPHGSVISNGARDLQLDLRARIDFGPNFQSPPDDFGTLAHARQAEVAGASCPGDCGKALAVLPPLHPELPPRVIDHSPDQARFRVAKGVAQRLSRDSVSLIAHNRVQVARDALHLHVDDRRIRRSRHSTTFLCD